MSCLHLLLAYIAVKLWPQKKAATAQGNGTLPSARAVEPDTDKVPALTR